MTKKTRRVAKARRALLALSLVLVTMMVTVGGTIAWLTANTTPVVNTFTPSNIDITLAETKEDFKMVPGSTIAKDPKVTVVAGSENCWLFVKIDESTVLDTYISYTVASGWTPLTGVDGVYYREASAGDTFSVLAGDTVTVNNTVTKELMDALEVTGATQPTLTFTAYAVQKENVGTAAEAWAKLNP